MTIIMNDSWERLRSRTRTALPTAVRVPYLGRSPPLLWWLAPSFANIMQCINIVSSFVLGRESKCHLANLKPHRAL